MPRPKRVAIIGAGPSGLVTAKTLHNNFPAGTFSPTIFEKRHEIGGLWPNRHPNIHGDTIRTRKEDDSAGPLNPLMRTNLSRCSVAFSDLAWESIIEGSDIPIFPQAWQVGRYLGKYAERYLPKDVVRLGHKVVRTSREIRAGEGVMWTVHWVRESLDRGESTIGRDGLEVTSEQFDYLVVASGYFSRPYIPDITGLARFADRTVHSSTLKSIEDLNRLFEKSDTGGKLVVIGGGMSGAEAASSLALHLSSLGFAPELPNQKTMKPYEVHHVCTRPCWILPTYLPYTYQRDVTDTKMISFLPLDLALYDLAQRPPGSMEYTFGPVSQQQIANMNKNFHSLLGNDYTNIGPTRPDFDSNKGENMQPPWVAVEDDYSEYVRSEAINVTFGRVCAVHYSPQTDLASVDVQHPSNEIESLDNVAGIILATGFTPFPSLSFLPAEVLSTLNYSPKDPFLPLVLDGKGTSHSEIPDLGFVGFYRAPYWGVMEMQARSIAETWARTECGHGFQSPDKKEQERQTVHDLRLADPNVNRGQFPMGDYMGLMESFASELGISRTSVPELGDQPGPVVPARYISENQRDKRGESLKKIEAEITMDALRSTLFHPSNIPSPGTAMAIFRALHGTWNFTRLHQTRNECREIENKVSGKATFHPRYPSNPGYEKEYIYEEIEYDSDKQTPTKKSRSIYRLKDTSHTNTQILIWSVDVAHDPNSVRRFSHGLSLIPQGLEDYIVRATGHFSPEAHDSHIRGQSSTCRYEYGFTFDGVAISSWECTVYKTSPESEEPEFELKTVYIR